jgi:cytidylate kinase
VPSRDAVIIDTSDLDVEQAVAAALAAVQGVR